MHTANEYYRRHKEGKMAGGPLLDCSNCVLRGKVPLHFEHTKWLGIQRYQGVVLPTFPQILLAWDNSRISRDLQWKDVWISIADIASCFNQLHWATSVVRLMGFALKAS